MLFTRRMAVYPVAPGVFSTFVNIIRVATLINLLMLASELFTALYTGGEHSSSVYYLFFGLHGASGLVPWIWTSLLPNVIATFLFLHPATLRHPRWLAAACLWRFCGIWIEKGMGLIVPGFIPSALHEIVKYTPSVTEWKTTGGVWALGLLIFTVALKVAMPVLSGEIRDKITGRHKQENADVATSAK